MSRTARLAKALAFGYGYQLTVMVVGVVLTPLLLNRLGTDQYGQWLVVGQVLGLLGLLDLGVTAILGREVAAAAGGPDPDHALPRVVRRATWLVWYQTPVVGLVAAVTWVAVTARRPELATPLGLILAAFTAQFPTRIYAAVLTGLQDVTFGAAVQTASWAVTTALSVGLVLAGWGLDALAVGWAVGQGIGAVASYLRVRVRFPTARAWDGRPAGADLRSYLAASGWASTRQLAQLLLNGTELIVLAAVLGPAAVVLYSCTTRLVGVMNNQPYLLATTAVPAVSELRAAGDPARLVLACRALGVGVIGLSGGMAVALVAVSPAFVRLWVGDGQYAGPGVLLLAVLAMTTRHAAFTLGQTLFALGQDRRLAEMSVADGVVTVAATAGWTWATGSPVGVPLGSLTGVALVSGPVCLFGLASAVGSNPRHVLAWFGPWAWRFAAVIAPTAAAVFLLDAANPAVAAPLAVLGLTAYLLVMHPLVRRDPLRPYWGQAVAAVRRRFGLTRTTEAVAPPYAS